MSEMNSMSWDIEAMLQAGLEDYREQGYNKAVLVLLKDDDVDEQGVRLYDTTFFNQGMNLSEVILLLNQKSHDIMHLMKFAMEEENE